MKIKINLEPLTLGDSSQVFKLFNNEKVLQSYLEKPILNEAGTTDFIKRITSKGSWTWKITNHQTANTFIGLCSLHHHDKTNKTIEIGGTLLPEFWGKEIMARAFQILIEKAQLDFQVKQIIGRTLSINKNAIRLLEKLEFELLSSKSEEIVLVKRLE